MRTITGKVDAEVDGEKVSVGFTKSNIIQPAEWTIEHEGAPLGTVTLTEKRYNLRRMTVVRKRRAFTPDGKELNVRPARAGADATLWDGICALLNYKRSNEGVG